MSVLCVTRLRIETGLIINPKKGILHYYNKVLIDVLISRIEVKEIILAKYRM